MESILLKNGTVLDYVSNVNQKLDIKIENRKNYKNRKRHKRRSR